MKKLGINNSMHALATLGLALLFTSVAVAQTLPLRHGVYVLESSKCDDAPDAAISVWDGVGFSGAHSSGCTSNISNLADGSYRVSTKCTALGDGTPDQAGANFEEMMTLKHVSSTKFTATKATGAEMPYRWCSAK